MAGKKADDDHQHGSDQNCHAVVPAVEIIVTQRTGNGGQSVDVFTENSGSGLAHHVPEHTAAHTGEHAQKYAEKDIIPKSGIDSVLNADDRENSQTGSIEKVEQAVVEEGAGMFPAPILRYKDARYFLISGTL